ncbi:radical SAM protein [Methanobrevibacter filiformis]|uniref:Radical SAM superfamily protein n=1 Tax=Methanobrevibacter filiformis TaxID=55758 RepID=A0A166AYJ2_9EURY|nr:radical SAM protein [Methanobrevibacter filiformis]KZX12633.1 radical SAM superfamily protein [Methanobrevibacter filiformis]
METLRKAQILCDSSQYDLCDSANHIKKSDANLPGIYHTTGLNGCKIPLFKILMTNKCVNDCKYCINQQDRNFTRIELTPEEIAKIFLHYYTNDYVNGLFLSSGISKNIDNTMEKIIDVAKLLRKDYGYNDYIHLKILPGASKDSIKRSMALGDRISINMEAATPDGLNEIASTKNFQKDIVRRFKWIQTLGKRNPKLAPSGITTQLIIGANNESDQEVLGSISSMYKKLGLKRSYFSAFSPVTGTALEKREKCDTQRTNQLYHADALINQYKFDTDELIFNKDGFLSLDEDPKYLAALNRDIFPLEVNQASFKELLRVPGIGLISARKIIDIRKKKRFNNLNQLKSIGVVVKRAEPFIKIEGTHQTALDSFKV